MALNVSWGKKGRELWIFIETKVLFMDVNKLCQALSSSQNHSDMSDNCWPLCPFHLSVGWFLYVVFCPCFHNCVWVHIPNYRTQKMCFNFQNHVYSRRQQKNVEPWKDHFLLYIVKELTNKRSLLCYCIKVNYCNIVNMPWRYVGK